jgi:hypothetical protein
VCTRKRGEVYIGDRSYGPKEPKVAVRDRDTQEKRAKVTKKPTPSLPTLDPALVASATRFWGTVYGLTGERVGKAFVGDNGDDSVVMARPTNFSPALHNKQKRKRVFIGKVQEWWGIKHVRDLDPLPVPKGKGKRKAGDSSTVRVFIGKSLRALARRPRCPSPPSSTESSASDDDSPHDELEADGEGGEEIHWDFPPDVVSLGEEDVGRAIAAALSSLL